MGKRRDVALDPAVAAILDPGRAPRDEEKEEQPRRKTPHERGRGSRRLGVTFPSAAWADAVRELADRWRVRPADVLVLAVARLMADLEAGHVSGPRAPAEWQDRAGEMFDLQWEAE